MKFDIRLENWRIRTGIFASSTEDRFGAFIIPRQNQILRCIASDGDIEHDIHWEHVSVSLKNRCPNWEEMCYIKDLFWDSEEVVMQLHPAKSNYINNFDYCLHLWKPINEKIPLPPNETVGILERKNQC